jgi:hypothetical protein
MLRTALFAITLAFAAVAPIQAADAPNLNGDWLLNCLSPPGTIVQYDFFIVRIGEKAGARTATIVARPQRFPNVNITEFKVSGRTITLAFHGGHQYAVGRGGIFTGTFGGDPKNIRGVISGDTRVPGAQYRAQLIRTAESKIQSDIRISDCPRSVIEGVSLAKMASIHHLRAGLEKDPEKKQALLEEEHAAIKKRDEQEAGLYRTTIEKQPDSPYILDAIFPLLKTAPYSKLTGAEVERLTILAEKSAALYGPKCVEDVNLELAETLAPQKDFASIALRLLQPFTSNLRDDAPAAFQARVVNAYKNALAGFNRPEEARALEQRLAKLDAKLDADYQAAMPPFKPAAFAGRRDKSANRVAVVELFTGADCGPCVAADMAFDALAKAYRLTDVILLQYHLHIPNADPLTNPATESRAGYYGVNSTPSIFFNGKAQAGGGGDLDVSESRYARYVQVVEPLLEQATPLKLTGEAKRVGDKIQVAVEVSGAGASGDLRLRLVAIEEAIKYVGSNRLRFHHHVVRALPFGPEGVVLKGPALKHSATVKLDELRNDLSKYVAEYAANVQTFRSTPPPIDLTDLKFIALVQDEKTKAVVQATQFEPGEPRHAESGGAGR